MRLIPSAEMNARIGAVVLGLVLLLACPATAQKDATRSHRQAADDDTIVIEIPGRNSNKLVPPTDNADWLPVLVEGRQVKNLEELVVRVRELADARKFPDKRHQIGGISPAGSKQGVRFASRKRVLIQCAPNQEYSLVSRVLERLAYQQGMLWYEELDSHPSIIRMTLELPAQGKAVDLFIPTMEPEPGRGPPEHLPRITLSSRSNLSKKHQMRLTLRVFPNSREPKKYATVRLEEDSKGKWRIDSKRATELAKLDRGLGALFGFHARNLALEDVPVVLDVEANVPIIAAVLMMERARANGLRVTLPELYPASRRQQSDNQGRRRFGAARFARSDPRVQNREAVAAGLDWLARHQSPDGRWDCDGFMKNGDAALGPLCDGKGDVTFDVGVTGLAVLAFMGAGNTHREGAYQKELRNGLLWLRRHQQKSGRFWLEGFTRTGNQQHGSYEHAIASLAMAEAYGNTSSVLWRDSAQTGIKYVLRCQNPYRAWRYGVQSGESDVSVTSWMVMALASARLSGLIVNNDAMSWAHGFVRAMTDPSTGRTGYMKRGELPPRAPGRKEQFPASESESMTAAGMMVCLLAGEKPKDSEMLKMGSGLLSRRLPVWEPQTGRVDMYYWYRGTLAMFHMGGDPWKHWHKALKSAVEPSQRRDGNFNGSWDNCGPWGHDGGRIYSTALMTLSLEAYPRYPGWWHR